MSVLDGGIFSRPRGKTGGIVFGAARTRRGKQVTARLLVPPSNPNTPAQQTQKGIFSSVLDIVKRIGSATYRTDWNRSVGQLPGFQSLQSILMNQMNGSKDLTLVNPINLGILHYPDSVEVVKNTTTQLTVNWSAELGDNGTDADLVKIIIIAKTSTSREEPSTVVVEVTNERQDTTTDVTVGVASKIYAVYVYVAGEGTASGLYSVANPFNVDLV